MTKKESMTRRRFLGVVGGGLVAMVGGKAGWGKGDEGGERRPNIVFVLADDLGWAELGCYGNGFNETPHLDRLAKGGMRFTQAYAAAPVCSPYRAALMTGFYPIRTGITDYLRPNDAKHLSTDYLTIAEALQQRGYRTGIIGKWHLTGYETAGAEEYPPDKHGFEEVIVSENRGIGGGSYFHPYHFNRSIKKRLGGEDEKEYLVDRCNMEAVEFIERHKDRPFFLYLSHYAVHTRLAGKPELVRHFEQKPGAGEGSGAHHHNPHLAAQLKSIDEGVGAIREKLAELGLEEKTVLVFTSDNGGETRVTGNGPLREGKSTLYEGGIREPLIIRYPIMVRAGSVCAEPVVNIDFYPTFCELAGIEKDPLPEVDGVSLVPLLKDEKAKLGRESLYWHYPLERAHFLGGRSGGAIRKGDWKLIEFFDKNEVELYDLKHDPSELRNLAGKYRQRAKEMREELRAWREKAGKNR